MKYASLALLRRRLLLTAFALGGLLFLTDCATAQYSDPSLKSYKLAKEEEKRWRGVLQSRPDDFNAHYYLGRALSMQGKQMEGRSEFEMANGLVPASLMQHYNRALALEDSGRYAEAETEFQEAIRISPYNIWAHFEYWMCLDDQGKKKEAEREHHEYLKVRPRYPDSYFEMGSELEKRGKLREAMEEYRGAVRSEPNDGSVRLRLASVLIAHKEFGEAEKEYFEVLRLRREIGGILRKYQKWERRGDLGYPHQVEEKDTYYKLACLYSLWGKKEKAFRNLQKALEKGYSAWNIMAIDKDLDNLRKDKRYPELVETAKKRWEEKQKKEGK